MNTELTFILYANFNIYHNAGQSYAFAQSAFMFCGCMCVQWAMGMSTDFIVRLLY